MDRACIAWPINDRAQLLEVFNRVLYVIGVPDADADVCDTGDVGYKGRANSSGTPGSQSSR